MSDQPLTRSVLTSVLASALVKFHEEIIAPDVRRIAVMTERDPADHRGRHGDHRYNIWPQLGISVT